MWLLIDTETNFNSTCNHQLLRSVGSCATMKSLSNIGTLDCTQCGSLSLLPGIEVYYNPQSISKLLYMYVVTSKYCVTMDRVVEDVIFMHLGVINTSNLPGV